MKIDRDRVIEELELKSFGQKGWFSNKDLVCPDCGKGQKFGILFINDSGIVHHFRCGYKTSLYNYLKHIDRLDLVNSFQQISVTSELKSIVENSEREESLIELEEIKLPRRLKRLINDSYLDSRGFLLEHYREFEPSITNDFLEKELHNTIIFKIKQKKRCVAYLSRSRYSKEWHRENLHKARLGEEKLVLRYNNSKGTDFSKILGGLDSITKNTKVIILVEGLFDKVNTDKVLHLYEDEKIRCCFTFGNKISVEQIRLLREFKNLEEVILLYDYNTIKVSKQTSLLLTKYFNVSVGLIKDKNVDPGDMNFYEFKEVLSTLQNPIEFYINNLDSSVVQ